MELIRWIETLRQQEVPRAGGKGANLGEMVRAGLPVPPGFVLTTPAYRLFAEQNGIQMKIEQIASEADFEQTASVETASRSIRALFDRGSLPAEVKEAVLAAYERAGRGRVAVRSSATAEDLPGASFAGQQETFLNVEGAKALLHAVKRCWSSLWTPRAMVYRARQGIRPSDVALAVVVQQQVEAEVAGVLFTANPVNGRRDQMVIDGAWGLGEAVVSGQVTPDQWVADGQSGAILQEQINRKERMTVRQDGVTATLPVPPAKQNQPVLDAQRISELVALGRQAAAHFGEPQDIEWAWADGRFYLVQSRPITSLFPIPGPGPGPEHGLRTYICMNVLQGIVEPFTPMGLSFFGAFARGPARILGHPVPVGQVPAAVRTAAGRMYIDVASALRHPRTRRVILRLPAIIDRPTAETLKMLAERDERLQPVPGPMPARPPLSFVLQVISQALRALFRPDRTRQRALADMDASFAALEEEALRLRGVAERIRFVRERPADLMPLLLRKLFATVMVGMVSRWLTEVKMEQWLGDTAGFQAVLRSLPHNPTTEMDLELWRLSRTLLGEGAQPSANHRAVRAFLRQYGHRAIREIDVGMPRWTEEPDHILNVLRTYLTHDQQADAEAHFRRGAEEAEQAVAVIVQRVRKARGPLHAWLMRLWLSRTRSLVGMREFPKFYAVRHMALFRQVLMEAGADLVASGRLTRPEDIFFVTLSDLETEADLKMLAAANRAEYERELGRRAVPRVMTSEGETFYAPPVTKEGALVGAAASPGVYEGKVRVIHDPRGAQLEPGEVLVAPGTDPAWTPLFLTAGALVMEIGGIMSHGSVVAREYGIPAVVGVAGATQQLRTGQRIRVDGESGLVVPLD